MDDVLTVASVDLGVTGELADCALMSFSIFCFCMTTLNLFATSKSLLHSGFSFQKRILFLFKLSLARLVSRVSLDTGF